MNKYIDRIRLRINTWHRLSKYLAWQILNRQRGRLEKVYYISEGSDWVIKRIGRSLVKNVELPFEMVESPEYAVNSVLHFGSLHSYIKFRKQVSNRLNRIMVTVFHGDKKISAKWENSLNVILSDEGRISRIIVSNSIMRNRLMEWGIPAKKLCLIPIGIDLPKFRPVSSEEKRRIRESLGVPLDAICIGSFQKDGNGWGAGLEPKMVKGPDIFLRVVTQLSKHRKIHVLLTGPARGFVKQGLTDAGITFTHKYLKDNSELNDFYNGLDLYLVTSREEGGPMALMEAMASGTPLITTAVGMAPDIINNEDFGIMVPVADESALVTAAETILEDQKLHDKFVKNGLGKAKQFDWSIIAEKYNKLYQDVIDEKA